MLRDRRIEWSSGKIRGWIGLGRGLVHLPVTRFLADRIDASVKRPIV